MGDLDLHVTEGWLRRGFRPINPKTLTVEGSETVTATTPTPTTTWTSTDPSQAALLTPWDLTYLGSYRVPITIDGLATGYAYGLGLRRVNGEVRLFQGYGDGTTRVAELALPSTLSSTPPYTSTTVATLWGDIYQGLRVLQPGNGAWGTGLYWDEPDSRLYWSYLDKYDSHTWNYAVGATTLVGTTATAIGCWRPENYKATNGGMTAIPAAFAATHTGGKRLALGFGGYQSNISFGPCSMGPCLYAIDPPTTPHLSAITGQYLVYYPYDAAQLNNVARQCPRGAEYTNTLWGGPITNGVGYWQCPDSMRQSGVWISLADKAGFLSFSWRACGAIIYDNSIYPDGDIHCTEARTTCMVYSEAQLAQVASGGAFNALQPLRDDAWQWPEVTYPIAGNLGTNNSSEKYMSYIPQGIAFDASSRRLYVRIGGEASYPGAPYYAWYPLIRVYEVT